MGQYTIVIHGTGAHHNYNTADPKNEGRNFIVGRANDYDADLMFADFVEALKAKGHVIAGATLTVGSMSGVDAVIPRDYVNEYMPKADEPPT